MLWGGGGGVNISRYLAVCTVYSASPSPLHYQTSYNWSLVKWVCQHHHHCHCLTYLWLIGNISSSDKQNRKYCRTAALVKLLNFADIFSANLYFNNSNLSIYQTGHHYWCFEKMIKFCQVTLIGGRNKKVSSDTKGPGRYWTTSMWYSGLWSISVLCMALA